MRIALLSTSPRVPPVVLALIARAVERQVARHVAPAWGFSPSSVSAHASPVTVPLGTRRIVVQETPDEPDALGYHGDAAGAPYARVFVAPVVAAGGGILVDPTPGGFSCTVSSVVSHEALEMIADPYVNRWVDGPMRPEGSEYAYEIADPVEGDLYPIDAGEAGRPRTVMVSNFVFPEYFDVLTPIGSRLDQMGRLKAPFAMTPYGYMVVRQGGGTEQLIFGDACPAWYRATKHARGTRAGQRMGATAARAKTPSTDPPEAGRSGSGTLPVPPPDDDGSDGGPAAA